MKRSGFLASSASLVAIGATSAGATSPVPGGTHLVERHADFDQAAFDRLVGKPAAIRQLWEAVAFKPAMLNNIKNALNGLQFGFGLTPIAMHKPDEWLRTLHVNVSAPFALTQACMPLLTAASDSAVVFVLDNPELLQRAHWGGYGVSKAALERFVAILHQETDSSPMRSHALLPAPMRTALRRQAYFGEDTMQRPLPDAAAAAAVYLLSAQAGPARGTVLDLRIG